MKMGFRKERRRISREQKRLCLGIETSEGLSLANSLGCSTAKGHGRVGGRTRLRGREGRTNVDPAEGVPAPRQRTSSRQQSQCFIKRAGERERGRERLKGRKDFLSHSTQVRRMGCQRGGYFIPGRSDRRRGRKGDVLLREK